MLTIVRMKRLTFLLALSLCGVAVARAPAVPDAEPLFAAPTRVDRIGRIVAPVFINGLGPFRLVLDTGANHTTISPALAARLGLVPHVDNELMLHGVTGAEVVPAVIVDRLQAGELIVEGVRVPVIATDIMAGADGILGVAGLTRERISVNFRADRITIARSKGLLPSGVLRIPTARVAGGLLMVEARVGGVRVRGVIDTGAEHSLGNLPLQAALKKRRRLQPPRSTAVFGTTTAISNGQLSGVPDIKIGTATISQMNLVFGDFHIFKVWDLAEEPAMLIGMDVLGTVSELIIDFKLRTVYVVA